VETERCPKCDAPTVIAGHLATPGEGGANLCSVPRNTRFLRWKSGVGVPVSFLSCSSCGHLWTSLAPEELRAFIEKYGEELAKQQLESFEAGPDHDLPDCPEAREAADGVAEIDALVRADRQGEATRRYRELTRTKWDEAVDAVRGWRHLKRDRKLAMLGWRPKGSHQDDDPDVPDHPMRDRLLDG
jgi:hypothetical protein